MIDRTLHTTRLLFWSTLADLMGLALEQQNWIRSNPKPAGWVLLAAILLVSFLAGRMAAVLIVSAIL